jgi:hypothetical protein
VTQYLADQSERTTGPDSAKTHRLAVLALVFAILLPPAGIVLAILVLRQPQRERRDGRLAIGALVVAVLVLITELLFLILLTTFVATTNSTPSSRSAAASASAGSTGRATSGAAAGTAASPSGATDPKGVVTACGVVMPALSQVRTDVGKVKNGDQYSQVLTQLADTIVTGAGATTDPAFLSHVGQLSQAFQKAWQDSSNGKAPSAVADELTAAGAAVTRDCTAAGYHP